MQRARPERPLHLMRVEVENLQGFRHAVLDLGSREGARRPLRTAVLLGDNASGKTTLLRVMALGLAPPRDAQALAAALIGSPGRARRTREQARVRVELADPGAPAQRLAITTWITIADGRVAVRRETEPATAFPWSRVFVCGYGAQRGRPAQRSVRGHAARAAVASLFQRDARLLAPEALGPLSEAVTRHARAVAGLRGLALADPDPGDGASAMLAWLVDLIGRAQAAGALDARSRPAGIVLVDAIDAHLHPSRQRQVLGHLARRFPALQIVATAQSPEAVVQCAPGAVAVCRRHGAERTVVQDLPALAGRNADEILRGPWFGLAATVDDETAALLARYHERVRAGAGEDERERLREAVRARVGYFVATPLDELVAEVLAALASEVAGAAAAPGEPAEPAAPAASRQALVQAAVLALRRRLEERET